MAWAGAAPTDTPLTFALLATGAVSERRPMTVQQLAAVLPPEGRRAVDAGLAAQLPGWGDRRVDRETRAAVYRADPAGSCERAAYATTERRVSVRPAPDCMAWLTALLPMPEAVAARAALERAARDARATGEERTRGQVMADTLVERVTGQTVAAHVPVTIALVVTDRTLRGGQDPAHFADGTPFPAPMARDLVLATDAARQVRRLFTDPAGRLVTARPRRRRPRRRSPLERRLRRTLRAASRRPGIVVELPPRRCTAQRTS